MDVVRNWILWWPPETKVHAYTVILLQFSFLTVTALAHINSFFNRRCPSVLVNRTKKQQSPGNSTLSDLLQTCYLSCAFVSFQRIIKHKRWLAEDALLAFSHPAMRRQHQRNENISNLSSILNHILNFHKDRYCDSKETSMTRQS